METDLVLAKIKFVLKRMDLPLEKIYLVLVEVDLVLGRMGFVLERMDLALEKMDLVRC